MIRNLLKKFNSTLATITLQIGVVALACMVITITILVVLRYVFGYSPTYSEDLSKFLMVMFTFLFAPYAYRSHLHSGVSVLIEAWWPWLQHGVKCLLHALIFICSLYFCKVGIEFFNNGAGLISPTFSISFGYFYWIVPLSFMLMVPVALELFLDECALFKESLKGKDNS